MLPVLPYVDLDAGGKAEAIKLLAARQPSDLREDYCARLRSLLDDGGLDPRMFLTAVVGNHVAACLMVEVIPGGTAVFWTIRSLPGSERIEFEDALVETAVARLRERPVKLIQCLLPLDETGGIDALLRNGFRKLTRVFCLYRDVRAPHVEFVPSATVELSPVAAGNENQLAELLQRTSEGTLDCAELNGLRSPPEVLAGHLAAAPDRSRWRLIRRGGEAVGVLVLADAPTADHWDLAYLGIVPEARRGGLGRAAVTFALKAAARAGMHGLTLLVDERNHPARNLYRCLGFTHVDTREVFWRRP